ncbi:sugar kinase [Micromonospora sp. BRA006-A]|nr:sugar kinase [Micromonospora sp. BRA006-A]
MVVLAPDDGGRLEHAARLTVGVGGAESNVAAGLARLGTARRVSRVGDDPFGRRVVAEVAAAGVDVSLVAVDRDAPTGLYLKDPGRTAPACTTTGPGRRRAASARRTSAAGPGRARLLHLSGITAALSGTCRDLLVSALDGRALPGARVSFDVNHRPALWPADRAGPVLRDLADRADVVLVGLDEAAVLWSAGDPAAVRALLPGPELVVVKDGPVGATALPRTGPAVVVPALPVDVVEPVGAGTRSPPGSSPGAARPRPASLPAAGAPDRRAGAGRAGRHRAATGRGDDRAGAGAAGRGVAEDARARVRGGSGR